MHESNTIFIAKFEALSRSDKKFDVLPSAPYTVAEKLQLIVKCSHVISDRMVSSLDPTLALPVLAIL